jgi:hypothetical protein
MLVSPFLVLVFVPALLGVGDDIINRKWSKTTGVSAPDASSDTKAQA